MCSSGRMVTSRGVYVCPILIDFPGARMGETLRRDAAALRARPFRPATPATRRACRAGPDAAAGGGRTATSAGSPSSAGSTRTTSPSPRRCGSPGPGASTPSSRSATSARSARTPTARSRSCAERRIPAIQGNYEESLSAAAEDCHCGYTDPRDNHFAQISYDYTRREHRGRAQAAGWARCPATSACAVGARRVLLCHGSPRTINEFLWRSTTPDALHPQAAARPRSRPRGLHAHRPPLEPLRGARPRRRQRRRPGPARQRRAHQRVVRRARGGGRRRARPSSCPSPTTTSAWRARWKPRSCPRSSWRPSAPATGRRCLEILPAKESAAGKY